MNRETSTESASPEEERLLKYKLFAMAYSYPDDSFFEIFRNLKKERENLVVEYDRLFRAKEIWLYSTEYQAENEFQRSNYLSDITGFYKAFGLQSSRDRPDSLSSEFEFMHYLIFKTQKAERKMDDPSREEKISVCQDAQKKFFLEHILLAAQKIGAAVISKTSHWFYAGISQEMLDFLKKEQDYFEGMK